MIGLKARVRIGISFLRKKVKRRIEKRKNSRTPKMIRFMTTKKTPRIHATLSSRSAPRPHPPARGPDPHAAADASRTSPTPTRTGTGPRSPCVTGCRSRAPWASRSGESRAPRSPESDPTPHTTCTRSPWALCKCGSSCSTPTSSPATRPDSTRDPRTPARSARATRHTPTTHPPRRECPAPRWRSGRSCSARTDTACTRGCPRSRRSGRRRSRRSGW